jgi:DNA polymerase-3 subunit epsilon
MRPGQRNSLDALCRHYGIDNSKRTLHGALLDAELLADVYMAMTRGQDSLMMELDKPQQKSSDVVKQNKQPVLVRLANQAEISAHDEYLASLAKSSDCLWVKLESNVTNE